MKIISLILTEIYLVRYLENYQENSQRISTILTHQGVLGFWRVLVGFGRFWQILRFLAGCVQVLAGFCLLFRFPEPFGAFTTYRIL